MAIPGFEYFMFPILNSLKDGKEYYFKEIMEKILDETKLTPEERSKFLPSGSTLVVNSRVGWARTYLAKAGLIQNTRRGHSKITSDGINLLKQNIKEVNIKTLEQFDKFIKWRTKENTDDNNIEDENLFKNITPDELIENQLQLINNQLIDDIIEQLKQVSPVKFENIVVDLLVKMGYGGSKREVTQVVGKSGDGGIDGIIKEDKLGLDAIYVQAKRWDNQVGSPEIQKFAGALLGQKAKKGVFITTSTFSANAIKYVENLDTKIILIDGHYLAELMIEYKLGVSVIKSYEINKIDSDYFIEE